MFLGIIAVATLVMALIQVAPSSPLLRLARQAQQMMADVQHDVRPLLAKVTEVAEEASRTATLATAQAQKIDRLVTDLAQRVDETAGVVQQAIITPAREGMAIVAGLKAGSRRCAASASGRATAAAPTTKTRCSSVKIRPFY